jgi:hypothetical protein
MTQFELDHALALATGESPGTIRNRGFSLLTPDQPEIDEEQRLYLDCPGCGSQVRLAEHGLLSLPELAECSRCDVAYPYQYEELYTPEDCPTPPAECALAVA